MIVNGFIEPITKELPMEYAVEMKPPDRAADGRQHWLTAPNLPGFPRGAATAPLWRSELEMPNQKTKAGSSPTSRARDRRAHANAGARGRPRLRTATRASRWSDRWPAPPPTSATSWRRAGLGGLSPRPVRRPQRGAWDEGLLVYVPRGERLAQPARIEVGTGDGATSWRTLIVLEEAGRAEVWGATHPRTALGAPQRRREIIVGPGRVAPATSASRSSPSAAGSSRRSGPSSPATPPWSGSPWLRLRRRQGPHGDQAGRPGSSARVTGAYVGRGRQHLDFDTTQEHARSTRSPTWRSAGSWPSATAVWRGMIRVDPGAQQTDAFQEAATCCCLRRLTPTRSPAWRSRPTTSAAPTPLAVAPDRPRAALLPVQPRHSPPEAERLVITGSSPSCSSAP